MITVSRRILLISLCLIFGMLGCSRRQAQEPIDACALLKNAEIEAVQGAPIRESKSSANANNGFRVAQCYYAANDNSKSVVLTATQRDPAQPATRTARKIWDDMFSAEAREEKNEREGEEGEKMMAPKKIDGVGDDAYWTGARFGGALYVLRKEKDTFIRISVGGADTEESKIEKSKILAGKALGRL